jgi:hypothetical protein
VATIHTVGPGDIIGEHGQHAVNVPRVKAIVDALEEFDITIHWVSLRGMASALRQKPYIFIYARYHDGGCKG